MDKRNTKVSKDDQPLFSKHKSYSIAEIIAAGGTTAFANKLGKHPENIGTTLKHFPDEAFLTEDEFAQALETLKSSK